MMKSQIQVKMIEDSISKTNRICTLQLKYHRYIHAEFMTHRVFLDLHPVQEQYQSKKLYQKFGIIQQRHCIGVKIFLVCKLKLN